MPMSKIQLVGKDDETMKLGDYHYDAKENTLKVGGGDLVEEFSQLNPDEGGDSSE